MSTRLTGVEGVILSALEILGDGTKSKRPDAVAGGIGGGLMYHRNL